MNTPAKVTRKGVEALELWSQGMSTRGIAERLGVNVRTVGSRLDRARRLLGAAHGGHAVGLAMAAGLIGGPAPVACVAVPDRTARPLEQFAEDYKIYRWSRGMSHHAIAEALGVKPLTVGRLVSRARKAGLLPPYNPAVTS